MEIGNWEFSNKLTETNRKADWGFGYTVCFAGNNLIVGSPQCSLNEAGNDSIAQAGAIFDFEEVMISGHVFQDNNNNGIPESNEIGLEQRIGIITPGDIILQTNTKGDWHIKTMP